MRLLIIGDIIGKPARKCLRELLPELRDQLSPDLTIANVENASGGFGLTKKVYKELKDLGIDLFTSGNHIWDKKEVLEFIDTAPDLLRPANYPSGVPGRGYATFEVRGGKKVTIINLMGRIFLDPNLDNPFRKFDEIYEEVGEVSDAVVVDFHAETTSEKWAFGLYADGRASVVYGTHTHIPTADETILPEGTAYVTDVGMTGALFSVIGMRAREPIERFLYGMPRRFQVEDKGDIIFNAIVVDIGDEGRAVEIKRIKRILKR